MAIHKVWLDLQSGTWGDANKLAILVLTDDELESFSEMSDKERCDYWEGSIPYFDRGNVV